MRKKTRKTWLVLVGLLFSLLADENMAKPKADQGVRRHGPPAWAPAHGYRRKFLYYPGHKIFYDTQKKQYIWLEAGKVKVGVELPKGIRVGEEGVSVELSREMPLAKDFK